MGGCGAFGVDWKRMRPHLEKLELVGPLRFPLQDVLAAKNIRVLYTNYVRTFPPLGFLLKLPHLREFGIGMSDPKWSKQDWENYYRINARSGLRKVGKVEILGLCD